MNDSGKELFSANAMSTDTGPSARVAGDTSSPDDPNLTVNAPKDINDNTGDLFASLPEFARKDVWMARDGGDSNVSVRNDVRRIVAASPTKVVESKMIEESEDFSIQGRLPAANRSALRIFAEGGIAADLSPVVPPLPAGISDDEIPPPADVVNGPSNEQQEANQENNPTEPKVTIPMDVVPAQDGAMQSLPNDVPVPELASSMAEEQPVTIAPAPADSVAQEAQKVVDQPAEASVPVETPKSIESWTPAVNMDDLFSELPDKPAIPETVPAQDIAATEVPAAVAEPEANESAQSPVAEPEPVVAPATEAPVAQEAQKVVDQPAGVSVPVETPKSIESWTPAVNMDDLFSELPDKPAIPETVPAQDIVATEVPVAVAEPEVGGSAPSPAEEPVAVVSPQQDIVKPIEPSADTQKEPPTSTTTNQESIAISVAAPKTSDPQAIVIDGSTNTMPPVVEPATLTGEHSFDVSSSTVSGGNAATEKEPEKVIDHVNVSETESAGKSSNDNAPETIVVPETMQEPEAKPVIEARAVENADTDGPVAPVDVAPELEATASDTAIAPSAEVDGQSMSKNDGHVEAIDDVVNSMTKEPKELDQPRTKENVAEPQNVTAEIGPEQGEQTSKPPAFESNGQSGIDDSGELPFGDELVVDDVIAKDLGGAEHNAVEPEETQQEQSENTNFKGSKPDDSFKQENVGTQAGNTDSQEDLTMEIAGSEEQKPVDGGDVVLNGPDDTEGQTILGVGDVDTSNPPYVPRMVAASEINFNTKPQNLVEAEYRRTYRHKISAAGSLAEIGSALKNIREQEGLSRVALYEQTKISTLYIEALEEGKMEELPPGPYVVGYVRRICDVLSIDVDELSEFFSGLLVYEIPETKPTNKVMRSPEQERKLQIIAITIISLLVLFVLLLLSGIGFVCYKVYGANNANEEEAVIEKELRGYIQKPSLRITIMPKRVK